MGEGEDDGDGGAIRGGERNSGGSSPGDSIINNDDDDDDDDGTEAMDVLNRNEAVLMSHDFHYAEYLDTRHHPAGSLHPSKNSASGLAGSAASSSGCEMGLVRSSRTERAAMAELQARLGEAWARAREIGGGGVQC